MIKACVVLVLILTIRCNTQSLEPTQSAERVARKAVEAIISGNYEEFASCFDEKLIQQGLVSSDILSIAISEMTKNTGPIQEIRQVQYVTRNTMTHLIVTTVCQQHYILDIAISIDETQKIKSFFFKPPQVDFVYKPPKYVKKDRFREETLLYGNEYPLPATFTVPINKKTFPAVILVHGSGPNDRDLTIGQNKPFRDIAWALASEGIGVFRYEKRTRLYSDKGSADTPKAEVVDDVLEAIKYLKNRKDVSSVYVLGLSLGGMMMPMIMEHDTDAAGFIMCAAPARKLQELYIEQYNYILSLSGEMTKAQKRYLEYITEQADRITKGEFDDSTTADELLNIPPSYWKDLNAYDQTNVLKKQSRPVLILQGEADYQITMQDFGMWKTAMSGKRNVTFVSYPRLNHLFIEGSEKSRPADYEKEGHVHAKVIKDSIKWIKTREKERSKQ